MTFSRCTARAGGIILILEIIEWTWSLSYSAEAAGRARIGGPAFVRFKCFSVYIVSVVMISTSVDLVIHVAGKINAHEVAFYVRAERLKSGKRI